MKTEIGVIDYGMCNMLSITRGLEKIGVNPIIINKASQIRNFPFLVLPGVGSFPDGMRELNERGYFEELKLVSDRNQKLLGICLGMQMLFSYSEEITYTKGLDLIKGGVLKLPENNGFKIPNVNWHQIHFANNSLNAPVLENLIQPMYMYFVHSFYVKPEDENVLLAKTSLKDFVFASAVRKENIFGTQFHPEKSGVNGLQLLKNIISLF